MRRVAATMVLGLAVSGPVAAADACIPSEKTRVLQDFNTSYHLSQEPSDWGLCIKHHACTWGTQVFADAVVAGFGAYTARGDGTCTTSFSAVGDDHHPWSCDPPFDESAVADRLTAILQLVPGSCNATPQELWSAKVGGEEFAFLNLSLPLNAGSYCVAVVIRMRDLEPFLVVSGNCPDAAAAQQVVASIDPSVLQDFGSIVAVDSTGRGFARPFGAGATRVWGGLDETGTTAWLEAIDRAARARIALASTPPAPLELEDSGYEARLVQWFAAAVGRLDQRMPLPAASDRSREARDWMAANVLTREDAFKDTLFRPELLAP